MQLQQCYADRHAGTYNCSDSQAVVHRGGRGVVENAKVETTSDGGGGSGCSGGGGGCCGGRFGIVTRHDFGLRQLKLVHANVNWNLAVPETWRTKLALELFTTFYSQDRRVNIPSTKGFFLFEILPGMPIGNKLF